MASHTTWNASHASSCLIYCGTVWRLRVAQYDGERFLHHAGAICSAPGMRKEWRSGAVSSVIPATFQTGLAELNDSEIRSARLAKYAIAGPTRIAPPQFAMRSSKTVSSCETFYILARKRGFRRHFTDRSASKAHSPGPDHTAQSDLTPVQITDRIGGFRHKPLALLRCKCIRVKFDSFFGDIELSSVRALTLARKLPYSGR